MRLFKTWVLVLFLPILLSGCSTVQYLWQAGRGQFAILNHARPIPEVVKDERTPPRIRALLAEVAAIKIFGEKAGLKPTKNYQEYVNLDRDAVVTVVSACQPLKFQPKEWKFPIVGGFPYLGFYDPSDAVKYATELRSQGFDVDVRGAPAYSTLGWFRDPILSTMIPEGEGAIGELVEVILHESLHATAYVNHQAFFNESAASFVSEKLTPLYFRETRGIDSKEEKAYAKGLEWQSRAMNRMHEGYVELDQVYSSVDPDQEKLKKKADVFAKLRTDLKWRGSRDLNNATLIGHREYSGNREVFSEMLKKCGQDFGAFLQGLSALKESDFSGAQTKELDGLLAVFPCGGRRS
ncbi:MAG: aminopeptidase [Cryobacterium sp.]|nr:aminopeptidase [Oligoflexia bacterium]